MLIKVENRAFELPNAPSPKQWGGPFSFALLADPQLGLYCNNHSWEEEKQQLQECASAAAACSPKPSFILVLGDLLHAPVPALTTKEPAATEHRRLRDEQASDFVAAVDGPSQDVPLLVVPGNHDVGSTPTAESVAEYEQLWGKDYFSFWVGGVKFLCVNSCFFYDDALTAKEAEEQFDWLEKELADAAAEKAKHVFLLQHHQFYWRCWDEPDSEVHAVECRQQNKVNQSCIFRLPSKWKHRLLPLLEKHKKTGESPKSSAPPAASPPTIVVRFSPVLACMTLFILFNGKNEKQDRKKSSFLNHNAWLANSHGQQAPSAIVDGQDACMKERVSCRGKMDEWKCTQTRTVSDAIDEERLFRSFSLLECVRCVQQRDTEQERNTIFKMKAEKKDLSKRRLMAKSVKKAPWKAPKNCLNENPGAHARKHACRGLQGIVCALLRRRFPPYKRSLSSTSPLLNGIGFAKASPLIMYMSRGSKDW
ncbi:hypothetical protein Esti_005167 [Eimeria stiedai]